MLTSVSVTLTVRAAPRRYPDPRAVLEVLKPVTWFPPMWAFACGVASSGEPVAGRWATVVAGVVLTGPLACAASQAVNDWFDREVDAVNEPHRPIPSGRLPGRWGLGVGIGWSALSLAVGMTLGRWGFAATAVAVLLSWAYSAPPARLKRNGWIGNAAVGLTYEGLAWATGAAVMLGGRAPALPILLLALLYSLGAHGIMTLNDFKSVDGDRRMGIGSLPARLGVDPAARVACAVMLGAQVMVVALLLAWHRPLSAAAVTALVIAQGVMMRRFVARPRERALWYSGFGVPLYVAGMMVCAFAVRGV
ncbi:MAG TPA: chlorophyll synthase ChlG [Longimicrobium sp.]|nr:chlorophyll synthase ChlG [Longimicrobium sp.]